MTDLVIHIHRWKAPPSRGGYVRGCRCDGCRDAERAYWYQRADREAKNERRRQQRKAKVTN